VSVADLQTLAQVQSRRRATPKHEMTGRVEEKAATDVDEKKLEKACLKTIWHRDKHRCRVCGCKVEKSLERTPRRGEGHHIAGRADRAVRFDPRSRLLVCALDHERLELNKLFILATAKQMFVCEENRKSYINADKKLKFQEAK
jgi:hypothetical protein